MNDTLLHSVGTHRTAHPNSAVRQELARQLHGHGVEFGPGCHPLALGPFVESIRFCDAFDRQSFAEYFPEVAGEIEGFPDPVDFRLDFDKEWFVEEIGKGSLDFVIANHVLEHLVNPIRFLEQCHQLLSDGGLLYIGQPDKRRMFDGDRRRTSLTDVLERYQANETLLAESRIVEYVNQVDRPATPFRPGADGYLEEIERQRKRSLHVNVWVIDDLIELFVYMGRRLSLPWELVDGIATDDEFLLLFRKTDRMDAADHYPVALARLWADSQRHVLESRFLPRLRELESLSLKMHERLLAMDERVRETQNLIRRFKGLVRGIPGAKLAERWLRKANQK